MSRRSLVIVAVLLAPLSALAQQINEPLPPPPMVPAGPPPPMPAVEPPPNIGTPPPPAPPPAYVPNAPNSGYQYSPYGQPASHEKPGPEVGLMVSESLFGMLTAAGVTVLPYFLLFANGQLLGDETVSSVIFVLIFSAVPLAVAQTQVSLANGSRFYFSETWPAALAGLAAQAAVLGIYYATGWLPKPQVSGGAAATGGSVAFLLIGSIGIVPLIQMALINLTKSSKIRPYAVNFKPGEGITIGMPTPSPILAQTRLGLAYGVNFSFLNMTF